MRFCKWCKWLEVMPQRLELQSNQWPCTVALLIDWKMIFSPHHHHQGLDERNNKHINNSTFSLRIKVCRQQHCLLSSVRKYKYPGSTVNAPNLADWMLFRMVSSTTFPSSSATLFASSFKSLLSRFLSGRLFSNIALSNNTFILAITALFSL